MVNVGNGQGSGTNVVVGDGHVSGADVAGDNGELSGSVRPADPPHTDINTHGCRGSTHTPPGELSLCPPPHLSSGPLPRALRNSSTEAHKQHVMMQGI
jgi:hypothetical protein